VDNLGFVYRKIVQQPSNAMSDINTARMVDALPALFATEVVAGGFWLTVAETIAVVTPVPPGFGAT
jgi:hypothetical protein